MKSYPKILFFLLTVCLSITLFSCGDTTIEIPNQAITPQTTTATEITENNDTTITNIEEGDGSCEHIYEEKIILAATCTKEGITKSTCTLCQKTQTANIPKLAHVEITDKGFEPSCTASGLSDGKHCNVCKTITLAQKPIAPFGHTEVIDYAIPATCTATGKTEGKHCSICSTVLVEQETVNMLPHTEAIDSAIPATCTATGKTEGKHCSICSTVLVEQETVNMLPHTEVIDHAIPATCTATGKTEGKHCSICSTILVEQETVNMLPHTEAIDSAIPATCTEPGLSEGKHCNVCSIVLIEQEPIAELGHTEVIDAAIPATCTESGLSEGKHCSVCSTVIVAQETVEKLGHSTIKRTHTPVTCKTNGIVEIYCTTCQTILEYESIIKGHYSANHEYAQITSDEFGNLCESFIHGDKCDICDTRFIAPGTYTIMGSMLKSEDYIGKENFNFEYYNESNKKQTAQSFLLSEKEDKLYMCLELDGVIMEVFQSLVINITEEYFAEVSDEFYTKIFLKYFESGKYNLSGKYMWDKALVFFDDIEQNIKYTYSLKNSTAKMTGTKIKVIEDIATTDLVKGIISYDDIPEAIYFVSDPYTEWGYAVEYEIDFGKNHQTVSKEFFEWFTYDAANKVTS